MNEEVIRDLIRDCKKTLRETDNYHIPENIRIKKVKSFLMDVNAVLKRVYYYLIDRREEVFVVLLDDVMRQNKKFFETDAGALDEAENLLRLNLQIEKYLFAVDTAPWQLGRKMSHFEKIRVRRAVKKILHDAYDPNTRRPVRGTKVHVALAGSLSTGYSDWKLINGGDVPKPSDYGIPKAFRSHSKSVLRKIDEQLMLPKELQKSFSDVDLVIVNEVIFDSVKVRHKSWSARLGEKYGEGVGGSPIMKKLHEKLRTLKFGGIRGRWINYIVLRDEKGFENYMESRRDVIRKLQSKVGKKIEIEDNLIFEGIIS